MNRPENSSEIWTAAMVHSSPAYRLLPPTDLQTCASLEESTVFCFFYGGLPSCWCFQKAALHMKNCSFHMLGHCGYIFTFITLEFWPGWRSRFYKIMGWAHAFIGICISMTRWVLWFSNVNSEVTAGGFHSVWFTHGLLGCNHDLSARQRSKGIKAHQNDWLDSFWLSQRSRK